MSKYKDISKIYSFDNGRGNVSCCIAYNEVTPLHITERGGELSGFAETKKGNIIIGADLSAVDYNTFKECKVNLDLKKRPTEENFDELVKYFTAWRSKVLKVPSENYEKNNKDDVWFIGCPSAWSSDDIKLYIEIFRKAGFPNPIVIPESVAAAKYCRDNSEINENSLLVIDFGAYSNDCSCIKNDASFSVGSYLGAHIIEEMIICANLYRSKDYARDPARLNHLLIEDIAEEVKENENLRNFLILQGRKLKEKYFKEINNGNLGNKDIILPVTLENGRILNLFVNVKMINDLIYDYPIKSILTQQIFETLPQEVQNEIDNKKYIDCFSDFLDEIALNGKEIITPGDTAIILTGGASAMDFVLPMVVEKFKGCVVKTGNNPVEAVAEGLILLSQEKLLFMRTSSILSSLSEEENEKQTNITFDAAKSFYSDLQKAIISAYKTIFDTNIIFWRKRVYSCSQIYEEMDKDLEKRFREELIDKFPELFNKSCSDIEKFCKNLDDGLLYEKTGKNVFFNTQLVKEVSEKFANDAEKQEIFKAVYDLITTPAREVVDAFKERKPFSYFFRKDCENFIIKNIHPEIEKILTEIFTQELFILVADMFGLLVANVSLASSTTTFIDIFPNICIFSEDDYNSTQIS